ncbi:MAG: tRNA uridine-5-carboxymethylaminomethyl(34) synthesis GTPase MnmE [Candidatus Eisenbacteria bacterium]|nr:tRNA uridine-5-carboxymethylaminomethyl(34) synthesis GTPase MnmE [Candidatus Eisenbacteria bacterium]
MHEFDDTIAAIATAPGAAGLAVLRVSGARALEIADGVFHGRGTLAAAAGHTLHHGWAVWPGAAGSAENPAGPIVDEVVAALFRAPHSYTREDVVELSCHGGALNAARLLDALIAAGARLARPGEFTLRAFLSGRLDLAQAEAVADLIHAETESARELALSQLSGALSGRLATIEERLADAAAEVEARVDFAEDVGGIEVPAHVVEAVSDVDASLAALLDGSDWSRAIREGARVPLVGRPNAGKSSLFNALLGQERAIVTQLPGTTRDRVSEAIEIAGVRVTLSDTAGLRDPSDEIEAIGVERTHAAIADCRVALWVVDGSTAPAEADRTIARALEGKRVLVALNKCDLPRAARLDSLESWRSAEPRRVVAVSATQGSGIDSLRDALAELIGAGIGDAGGLALAASNPRHIEALGRARAALARARDVASAGAPGEIVALELRDALGAIGEVTGRGVGDDLLDRIFSRFCIGK